ncbi:MAG: ArnT family glycosyltransferase [Methylococcaceae bacterium]
MTVGGRSINPGTGFCLAIALYFSLHLFLRVGFSDSLELDEAEQWLFVQWLDWGYSSQPPLYTWLLKGLFAIFGESILITALTKNLCLCALYGVTFLLARRVLGDEPRAVLAALSLLLMPPIAWEASRDLTHTVLVACWVPASLLVVLNLLQQPTLRMYGLFGLVMGLGFLSKYNFSVHAVALLLSLLSLGEGRRILLNRRILLSGLLASLMYLPHGLWMLDHQLELSRGMVKLGLTAHHSLIPSSKLAISVAAYTAPLLLIVGLVWGFRQAERPKLVATPETRILTRYLLMVLLIVWVGMSFVDSGHIRTRWLFPFMVVLPVWLYTQIPAAAMSPLRSRLHLGCVGVAASSILVLMVLRVPGAAWTQKSTDLNLPFTTVADDLRQAGFTRGIIVAANAHMAGNLRYQFRDQAQVLTPQLDFHWPERPVAPKVLLFWEAEKRDEMPEALSAFAQDHLGVDAHTLKPHYLLHPYRYSESLKSKMAYVVVSLAH